MAFNNNALTARLDELRSRNPPRVPSEGNTGQNTPFRYSGSYMGTSQQQLPASSGAEPPSLQRRFTADLSKMSIAPIGELSQNTEPLEMPNIVSPATPLPPQSSSHPFLLMFCPIQILHLEGRFASTINSKHSIFMFTFLMSTKSPAGS